MKTYYDFLKYEINNFEGDFDNFILYIPEFFKLLCDLLEEDILKEEKRMINTALAYFVVPNDIIPEDIYGPMGYVDDIYVCSVVLKQLYNKYENLICKHWDYDEDFNSVLSTCYKESHKILKEKNLIDDIFNYTGLEKEL